MRHLICAVACLATIIATSASGKTVDSPQGKVLDASLGCTIVICAASKNPSWHTVPFCVPVMRDLLAAMSEPGFSWPVCENAKTGVPRHEIYDRCPAVPCPLRADPWFFEVPDDGHGKRRIWFNLKPPSSEP